MYSANFTSYLRTARKNLVTSWLACGHWIQARSSGMIVSKNIRERCFTTGTRKNKWRLHRAFTACTLVTRFFAVMITTVKNSDNEKKMFLCTRKLDKLSIGYFVSLKFSWFYFVFKDNFPNTSPWGAYIWRGDLMEGFLRYRFWGLIFGGAYTQRGLFSEF